MMTHPLLPKLRQLRLSGMLETLDIRARQAQEQALQPEEFLALLLDDELQRRDQGRLERLLAEAGIDAAKTISRFDFAAAPSAPRQLLQDLATCRFVERGENILFAGPTGTGKSHLAQSLVFEAVRRGKRALFRPAGRLLASLHAARADGTYARIRAKLVHIDLLALDDFGLLPMTPQAAEDLYDLVCERYERRSIVLTSNRACEEWIEVFGNPLLAGAALDRLTHHAHIVTLKGNSYRQRREKTERNAEAKA
jgi:DNA replication protein DnaC